jgi:hypothetical protein
MDFRPRSNEQIAIFLYSGTDVDADIVLARLRLGLEHDADRRTQADAGAIRSTKMTDQGNGKDYASRQD